MEKIGLLDRDADARDARLVFVVITKAGKEKLSEALATFTKRAGYLFDDRWSEEEMEHFSTMLQRVAPGASGTLTSSLIGQSEAFDHKAFWVRCVCDDHDWLLDGCERY